MTILIPEFRHSPSNANAFLHRKCAWAMRYCFDVKLDIKSGPAVCGIVAEETAAHYLQPVLEMEHEVRHYEKYVEDILEAAQAAFDNRLDGVVEKERDIVGPTTITFLERLKEIFNEDRLVRTQVKHTKEMAKLDRIQLPYPLVGYTDFETDTTIVDTKYTSRIPSGEGTMSEEHVLQAGIYNWMSGGKRVCMLYANEKKSNPIWLSEDTLKEGARMGFAAMQSIESLATMCHTQSLL